MGGTTICSLFLSRLHTEKTMMSEQANIEIVQRLYTDFGHNDIPTLLEALGPAIK